MFYIDIEIFNLEILVTAKQTTKEENSFQNYIIMFCGKNKIVLLYIYYLFS